MIKKLLKNIKDIKLFGHIPYNKVIAVNAINDFIECPADIPNASIAFKMRDDSMDPKLQMDSYVFLELNTPLDNRDFGLFKYKGDYIVRRFIIRQDKLILRPENKDYPEFDLSEDDDFTIIGRVIPNSK